MKIFIGNFSVVSSVVSLWNFIHLGNGFQTSKPSTVETRLKPLNITFRFHLKKIMSLFIRKKVVSSKGGGKHKRKPSSSISQKGFKKTKGFNDKIDEDEIVSSEDEIDNEETERKILEAEEEERLTAQEKKVKLAKKYLAEIEAEGEGGKDALVSRLRDEVLEQAGKLWKSLAGKFKTSYSSSDISVLKCKEHKLSLTSIVISSDSLYLFSGSKEGTIVKWCLQSNNKIKSIPPRFKCKENETLHNSAILCLAISSENKYLASSDEGKIIRLWDPSSLVWIHSFTGHRDAVTGLTFCRFSQTLFSCSRDKTVKVWNLADMVYVETLFGHQTPITGIDFLAKNRVVTSGGSDNTVRVWKIQEESQLIFNGQSRSLDGIKRVSDSQFISCGDLGEICLWSVLKKKPLQIFKEAHGQDPVSGEAFWIISLASIPNSEIFASGSSDGNLKLWRLDSNSRSFSPFSQISVTGFINDLAFAPNDQFLVAAIGQEHRLGRWSSNKQAKNSILIIDLQNS